MTTNADASLSIVILTGLVASGQIALPADAQAGVTATASLPSIVDKTVSVVKAIGPIIDDLPADLTPSNKRAVLQAAYDSAFLVVQSEWHFYPDTGFGDLARSTMTKAAAEIAALTPATPETEPAA